MSIVVVFAGCTADGTDKRDESPRGAGWGAVLAPGQSASIPLIVAAVEPPRNVRPNFNGKQPPLGPGRYLLAASTASCNLNQGGSCKRLPRGAADHGHPQADVRLIRLLLPSLNPAREPSIEIFATYGPPFCSPELLRPSIRSPSPREYGAEPISAGREAVSSFLHPSPRRSAPGPVPSGSL